MTGIDNYAHLGGWISGMLLGLSFNEARAPVHWMERHITWIKVVSGILAAAYYITLTVCIFTIIDAFGGYVLYLSVCVEHVVICGVCLVDVQSAGEISRRVNGWIELWERNMSFLITPD